MSLRRFSRHIADQIADRDVALASNLGKLNVSAIVVTPTGVAATDTAALLAAITAAAGVADVRIAGGTCVVDTITLPSSATVRLDDEAILKHADASTSHMFNVPAGLDFTLTGGTCDGNRANQTQYNRAIVRASVPSGSRLRVLDVDFTGTRAAAVMVYEFGGEFDISHCRFEDMAEHDGVSQHATAAVLVESGEVGARAHGRFSFNRCIGTITPALAGGSPGGIFFAPTTNYVAGEGNFATLEAIGNYFYGIGQNCAGNDIAPLHTYPTTEGARFIANYFEGCGFSAIAAKSTRNFVCIGNTIRDGQTSAQNDPASGAIYYTPGDHAASYSRPRAIISGNIVDTPGGSATVKQNGISVIGTPTSYADEVIVSDNIVTGCGKGIFLDYVNDALVSGNRVTGSSGGADGTEQGIEPNHVTGVLRIVDNHITVANGYGIDCINGVSAATLIIERNYVKSTHATTYAILARGGAVEVIRGNTIDTPYYAISVDTDGSHSVGALAIDRSNVVLGGGLVNVSYANVTRLVGRIDAAEYVPQLITGVTSLWDSAYGITQATGKVTTWIDRVGGYSFAQPTDANRPLAINGAFASRLGLRFDGLASWMSSATTLATLLSGATSYLYLVLKPIAASRNAAAMYDNDGILMDTNGAWGAVIKNVSGTTPTIYGMAHDVGALYSAGIAPTLSKPILFALRHAGGKLDVRVNAGAWTGNVTNGDTTPLTAGLRLGAGYDNAHHAQFDIGAIVTANAAISSADDYRILRWAQQEFGVSF